MYQIDRRAKDEVDVENAVMAVGLPLGRRGFARETSQLVQGPKEIGSQFPRYRNVGLGGKAGAPRLAEIPRKKASFWILAV